MHAYVHISFCVSMCICIYASRYVCTRAYNYMDTRTPHTHEHVHLDNIGTTGGIMDAVCNLHLPMPLSDAADAGARDRILGGNPP